MKIKLEIEIPLLRGRLHIAYPMISFMHHPKGEVFLNNYFLNLECRKNGQCLDLCYVSLMERSNQAWMHYLNMHHYYHDFPKEKNMKLHEALLDELMKGNYICIYLDDYFLPKKLKIPRHRVYINLIYGVDTEQEYYHSVGYNEHNKFVELPIPFESVNQAFYLPIVETFRPDLQKEFSFNKEHFLLQIDDFLTSRNRLISAQSMDFFGTNKCDYVYGVAVYDRVVAHLLAVSDGQEYDLRNLYQLYELAVHNNRRIQYMAQNNLWVCSNKLIRLSKRALDNSQIANNIMLKYLIKKDVSLIKRAVEAVNNQKKDNIELYMEMVHGR